MKISNETKIGILAAVAITCLVLGVNFLKGKSFFDKNNKLYVSFPKVNGLLTSNPVLINGLQVGMVTELKEKSRNINDGIIVTVNLARDINIPSNSLAYISQDLLGASTISIEPGNASTFLKDGDTLLSKINVGLMDEIKANVNPALKTLDGTLTSVDSLVQVAGTFFDPKTKDNFQQVIANLNASTTALNNLLADKNSSLNQSLANVNTFTGGLANNSSKIDSTLSNLEALSSQLKAAQLDQTVKSLKATIESLNGILAKANTKDGSIGLLLNDKKLYNNLESTTKSLNILLDDLRVHPKRYINVSVFGKKDKSTPLSSPLIDSSNTSIQ